MDLADSHVVDDGCGGGGDCVSVSSLLYLLLSFSVVVLFSVRAIATITPCFSMTTD